MPLRMCLLMHSCSCPFHKSNEKGVAKMFTCRHFYVLVWKLLHEIGNNKTKKKHTTTKQTCSQSA